MTNAELAKKIDDQWKARERDREKDHEWKDKMMLMLQRVTNTVFDGNGEKSMVRALEDIQIRHVKEDERALIYKTIKKATMAALIASGAIIVKVLDIIFDMVLK